MGRERQISCIEHSIICFEMVPLEKEGSENKLYFDLIVLVIDMGNWGDLNFLSSSSVVVVVI